MIENEDNIGLNLSHFLPVSEEAWIAQVKKDLKEKPLEELTWQPASGIRMPPMAFAHAQRRKELKPLEFSNYSDDPAYGPRKWINYESIFVDDAEKANQLALKALEMGADGVCFHLTKEVTLQKLVKGILPAYCGLAFTLDTDPSALQRFLLDFYASQQTSLLEAESFIAYDPIKQQFLQNKPAPGADFMDYMRQSIESGAGKAISVDAGLYADAGADAVQQIALGLHHTAAYVDLLTDAGWSAEQVFNAMSFQMGTGTAYFVEIAKFRTYRALLKRMALTYGCEGREPYIFAYSSQWSKSFYDPYVNILRNTTEAMSAILGGVNGLGIYPHNSGMAVPGSADRRMSRNISLLLKEESYFDKVADPVAGSYYLEMLTEQMMQQAWDLFLQLEESGTLSENLASGVLSQMVEVSRQKQIRDISTRKQVMIGTNMYPNPKETLAELSAPELVTPKDHWHARHASAEIEAFRQKMEARKASICAWILPLSQGFMTAARITFTQSYLGVAGIVLQEWTGDILELPPADLVVLCGSDEDYATQSATYIASLKQDDKTRVFLAGDPGLHKEMLLQAGLDGWFSARSNVTDDLQQLLALIS